MKFEDALSKAVSLCESRGIDDPFYLYSVLSDYVGADLEARAKAVMLFDLDKRLQLVRNIRRGGAAACIVSKAAYPAFRARYDKKRFYDCIDDLYCVLTGTPLPERQSERPDKHKKTTLPVRRRGGNGQGKRLNNAKPPNNVNRPVRPTISGIPPGIPQKDYGAWLLYQAINKK